MLTSFCSRSACANGSPCDVKGNCGSCSISNPPRVFPTCACPAGYVDDGWNSQCQLMYNSTQTYSLVSQVTGITGVTFVQAAFRPGSSPQLFAATQSEGYLRVYDIANDDLNMTSYFYTGFTHVDGIAFIPDDPNYALISIASDSVKILNVASSTSFTLTQSLSVISDVR